MNLPGRHLAVLLVVIIWSIGYFGITYYVCSLFSNKNISSDHSVAISTKIKLLYALLSYSLIAPIVAGLSFRLGAVMEQGILWGCYIENYILYCFVLWLLSLHITTPILIVGLFSSKKMGFKKNIDLLLSYLIIHIYSILLILLLWIGICSLCDSLNGRYASCF